MPIRVSEEKLRAMQEASKNRYWKGAKVLKFAQKKQGKEEPYIFYIHPEDRVIDFDKIVKFAKMR